MVEVRRAADRPGQGGAALIIVVLVMMALTAVAHGLLLLARFEYLAARAGVDQLAARLAAEAAVNTALGLDVRSARASTPLWQSTATASGTLLDARYSRSILRLSREVWLAEGWGKQGRAAPATASRPIWVLDPVARVAAMGAVLVHGDGSLVRVDGTIDGSRVNRSLTPEPARCEPWSAALDSLMTSGTLPPTTTEAPDAVSALGPLDVDSLRARIQVHVAEMGTPEPHEQRGVCVTEDAWNWGDPDRPTSPCGHHFVTIFAEGDLVTVGGAGQGLLVVTGDADLLGHAVQRADHRERSTHASWHGHGARLGPLGRRRARRSQRIDRRVDVLGCCRSRFSGSRQTGSNPWSSISGATLGSLCATTVRRRPRWRAGPRGSHEFKE